MLHTGICIIRDTLVLGYRIGKNCHNLFSMATSKCRHVITSKKVVRIALIFTNNISHR